MGVLRLHKYARAAVDFHITCFSQDFRSPRPARLTRLSEEGGQLLLDHRIPVATAMALDVPLPGGSQPVHVTAEVLWVRRVQSAGRNAFAHGLMFLRLGAADRERLRAYIRNEPSY